MTNKHHKLSQNSSGDSRDEPLMVRMSHPSCRLLKTSDVAKLLGVSARTVCLWAECDEIPAIRIGRQWRVRPEEIGTQCAVINRRQKDSANVEWPKTIDDMTQASRTSALSRRLFLADTKLLILLSAICIFKSSYFIPHFSGGKTLQ
jgi:excisionase family DNA binding protein